MMEVPAFFYDGKSSKKKEVLIRFDGSGGMRITGLDSDLVYRLSDVRIAPRIGNTPRSIHFPDGAKCETPDNDLIDEVLSRHGRGRFQRLVHTLESRLRFVIVSLVLTVIAIWAFVEFGIPVLAKRVAFAVPPSIEKTLGEEGLEELDRLSLFWPSDLDQARQNRLTSLFDTLTQHLNDGHDYRLEFRKSDRFGANAFALPSGIVVVTDDLVRLAENDKELIGIFAHEIGHVVHRHALRAMLQNSTGALLVGTVTGDVFSKSALSTALPTLLVQMKYSRAFETEADRYALHYLKANSIPPKHFSDILLRLERQHGGTGNTHDYLSSHPATSKRIKMFQRPKK